LGAALVAVDRDMIRRVKRFGESARSDRRPGLHLVFLDCPPGFAAKRVAGAMSFIEAEWRFACAKPARVLWVEIATHRLTTYR
jgi:hypothetical protein